MNKWNNNYTNYNKPKTEEIKEEAPVIGLDLAEGTDFTSGLDAEEVVVETTQELEDIRRTNSYKIAGCTSLNVRQTPNSKTVLVVLNSTSIFKVEYSKLTIDKDWTPIKTQDGIEGFVMTEYIKEI